MGTKKRGPAPRPAAQNVSDTVSARVMPGEREVLKKLLQLRASEMEARGEPPDPTFAGWLRATIRQQAKAAGFEVTPTFEAPVADKRASKTRRAD